MMRLHRYFAPVLATLFSLTLALTIAVGTAAAHAKVNQATPGIGSTIATVPTKVTVEALENMNPDPKASNLFVYGPSGGLISQGDAKVSLSNPKEMSINIKADGNGIYVVRWITKSAEDGDPDEGAFTFTVKPASAASTPQSGTTTSAPPANTSSSNNSFPFVPVALTGVIALLVGLGAGFGLGRGRANALASATGTEEEREKVTTKPDSQSK